MPIAERLERMLDDADADYEILEHTPAYTAQEEAAATHVPGKNWVKTVAALLDGEPVLLALPAHREVDLAALVEATAASSAELTKEEEFENLYPDSEVGAMPPFGVLYGQKTVLDETLRDDEYVAFHAGDHETAVRMRLEDYLELAEPVALPFSRPADD